MSPDSPVRRTAVAGARALVHGTFAGVRALIGQRRFLRGLGFILRQVDPVIEIAGIRFDGRDSIPLHRALTVLSKEPDTIHWIDDFIGNGDVFYDVGANVGVYSLYAALSRGARVLAFEPMCSNYEVLNRNIFLNGADDAIVAYNCAFHDRSILSRLNLSDFLPGKAGHSFESATGQVEGIEPAFRQGMLGMTMDDFIERFSAPFPNHIKIDVDGNEGLIVDGMARLLMDPRLRTIAIELDTTDNACHSATYDSIIAAGFSALKGPRYVNTQYVHYTNLRNHFFVRERAHTGPTT